MPHSTGAHWRLHNPTQVHFGAGTREALARLVDRGQVLAVSTARGRRQFSEDAVLGPLASGMTWVDSVSANPGLSETQAEIDRLAGQHFDAIIAFGGGSAMDAAKALAAGLAPGLATRELATLIAEPASYLTSPLLPIHALPTTSGTGAEVTPFATIWDHANRKKLSLASPYLFPVTAIVDPELTYDLPREATFSTGLDALNQAFESAWNGNCSPVTLLWAGRAVALALEALPRLHDDLTDRSARARIAEASLLAGLCISQTRTAICHSISYPLTAHFDLPHGLACAFTMGAVMNECMTDAPQTITALAQAAGQKDANALQTALGAVLAQLEVRARGMKHVTSLGAVLALQDEMYTPGRSDNFILPVTSETLERILATSVA